MSLTILPKPAFQDFVSCMLADYRLAGDGSKNGALDVSQTGMARNLAEAARVSSDFCLIKLRGIDRACVLTASWGVQNFSLDRILNNVISNAVKNTLACCPMLAKNGSIEYKYSYSCSRQHY